MHDTQVVAKNAVGLVSSRLGRGLPASEQFRISLHPELAEQFVTNGGGNWLKQMLVRQFLEELSQDRMASVVAWKMSLGSSFGDAWMFAQMNPNACLLKSGKIMDFDEAKYLGKELFPGRFILPDHMLVNASSGFGTGRPRRDYTEPEPELPRPGEVMGVEEPVRAPTPRPAQEPVEIPPETPQEREIRVAAYIEARRIARLQGKPTDIPFSRTAASPDDQ